MTHIRILVGSVYGGALMTAKAIKQALDTEGYSVSVLENPVLDDITSDAAPLLVCTSTTGQGEVPPTCCLLYRFARAATTASGPAFGVIVLGDSSYGDTFAVPASLWKKRFMKPPPVKLGKPCALMRWKPWSLKMKLCLGRGNG